MSIPTPNYVLTEELSMADGRGGHKVLPSGSFIRPIDKKYLPKHVLEDDKFKGYNIDSYEFCYSSAGIILVHKSQLRQV
jgi:hypothetical protein